MKVYVTDHALLRYFERIVGIDVPKGRLDDRTKLAAVVAVGIDIEGVRRRLGNIGCLDQAAASGATAAQICGARFILQGRTVVTVELPVWKHMVDGVQASNKAEYRRQTRRAGAPA